jgi:hypothetical protein
MAKFLKEIFNKANRLSLKSYQDVSLEEGLSWCSSHKSQKSEEFLYSPK